MKKAHTNPKSLKWIVAVVIMVAISIATIFATKAISGAMTTKANTEIASISVSKTTPVALEENEFNVTAVENAFDNAGNQVGYVIKTSTIGYNAEVPIEIATTITRDAKYIVGIDVINQMETEYLGVRIAANEFKDQFKGIKAPIVSSSSIEKGSKVDLIAKSTISSQAVVDGVNGAVSYAEQYLIAK